MDLGARLAVLPTGRRVRSLILLLWLVVAAVSLVLGGKLTDAEKNDTSSFLPGSAESTKVLALGRRFPGGTTNPAVVVYARPRVLTPPDLVKVAADRKALARFAARGTTVSPPIPAADRKALLLSVPLAQTSDAQQYTDDLAAIRGIVRAHAPPGLTVLVTGPAGYIGDAFSLIGNLNVTLLLATAGIVAVILLAVYRSPVLWLVPLVTVGVADQTATAVVYLLARYAGLTVNAQSAGILRVLVFGAGTDYALLLIARYREELHLHERPKDAMAVAIRQAGPPVVASAVTVVLSLLVLLVARLNSDKGLGPVGAAGIVCAFLAMTTLLPALLVLLGRRIFWPFVPRYGTPPHAADGGVWARVARTVGRRPRQITVVTVLVLLTLALGITRLTTGITQEKSYRKTIEAATGQNLIEQHYPAGAVAPTQVVALASHSRQVKAATAGTRGVAQVLDAGNAGPLVGWNVTLTDPPDGATARATIVRLRDGLHALPGAQALVGGSTAVDLDIRNAAVHDREVVIPIVLLLLLVVLGLLLQAVVAPFVLIATVVVSFLAALGVSVLAFQHLFHFAGADPALPLFGFIFLVALGIDYNIFLMSRVREEALEAGPREGIVRGLAVTGGVITSAGLVLAATFAVLTILPLVQLAEVGFLVAFGVLLDTFVVRSVLVPALGFDIGPPLWWPSRIAKAAAVLRGRHRRNRPPGAYTGPLPTPAHLSPTPAAGADRRTPAPPPSRPPPARPSVPPPSERPPAASSAERPSEQSAESGADGWTRGEPIEPPYPSPLDPAADIPTPAHGTPVRNTGGSHSTRRRPPREDPAAAPP